MLAGLVNHQIPSVEHPYTTIGVSGRPTPVRGLSLTGSGSPK